MSENEICFYCGYPKIHHTSERSSYSPAGHWTECTVTILKIHAAPTPSPSTKEREG